jgi:hypothetical protein
MPEIARCYGIIIKLALIAFPTSAAGSARSQGFQPWWYQARMA